MLEVRAWFPIPGLSARLHKEYEQLAQGVVSWMGLAKASMEKGCL